MDFLVRGALPGDIEGILAVETAAKGEIGREYISAELGNPVCRFYLAENPADLTIGAYLIAWRLDAQDFEIHHLATHPKFQLRGLARMLFNHLLNEHSDALKRIFLEVRAGNLQAVRFYQSLGFVQSGLRRKYYRNPVEDALLYQYSISVER